MRVELSHGYQRKGTVPKAPGTQVKTCSRCNLWFAARKSERACDTCLRPSERAKRFAKLPVPKTAISSKTVSNGAGQRTRKTITSKALGLTFTCPVTDPRYARLESIVLAHELAAMEKWSDPDARLVKSAQTPQDVKPYPSLGLSVADKNRITRRNVALGIQGV